MHSGFIKLLAIEMTLFILFDIGGVISEIFNLTTMCLVNTILMFMLVYVFFRTFIVMSRTLEEDDSDE